MFTLYWLPGFAVLLTLHFVVIPQILSAAAASRGGPKDPRPVYAKRCFLLWSGIITLFTVGFFVISVAVWGRAGYLGTLFFLCIPFAWLFRWLGDGTRDREESEFDEIEATLAGVRRRYHCWMGYDTVS